MMAISKTNFYRCSSEDLHLQAHDCSFTELSHSYCRIRPLGVVLTMEALLQIMHIFLAQQHALLVLLVGKLSEHSMIHSCWGNHCTPFMVAVHSTRKSSAAVLFSGQPGKQDFMIWCVCHADGHAWSWQPLR